MKLCGHPHESFAFCGIDHALRTIRPEAYLWSKDEDRREDALVEKMPRLWRMRRDKLQVTDSNFRHRRDLLHRPGLPELGSHPISSVLVCQQAVGLELPAPSKFHGRSLAMTSRAPKTMAWCGCSAAARLTHAKTMVLRDRGKRVATRPDSFDPSLDLPNDPGSSEITGSEPQEHQTLEDNITLLPSFHPRWSQAFAMGPRILSQDREGMLFEVRVELEPQKMEYFEHRAPDSTARQRPLLHIGVCQDAFAGPDHPWSEYQRCWLLSSWGQVVVSGKTCGSVPVAWPRAVPKRLSRGLRLGLLVTSAGALRLLVEGEVVCATSPGIVPVGAAQTPGTLAPFLVLGPNVVQAILSAPEQSS